MKLTPHIQNILNNSKKDTEWKKEAEERQAARKDSKKAGLVATQLAFYMKHIGMSQTKLGMMIGVSPQQISKILKGRQNLTLNTIETIEEALGIDLLPVSNLEAKIKDKPNVKPVDDNQSFHSEISSRYLNKEINTAYFFASKNIVKIQEHPQVFFEADYYEQIKKNAIQRANERFELIKDNQSFISQGSVAMYGTKFITNSLRSIKKEKWEEQGEFIVNEG